MFQQDYLMRLFMQLAEGIRKSIRRAIDEKDPEAAADMLEATVGEATELDGAVLLSLAPESIASVVQISGTDPRAVEYICRSLLLEAEYLREAGKSDKAELRSQQAYALGDAYGIDLTDVSLDEEALEEVCAVARVA